MGALAKTTPLPPPTKEFLVDASRGSRGYEHVLWETILVEPLAKSGH